MLAFGLSSDSNPEHLDQTKPDQTRVEEDEMSKVSTRNKRSSSVLAGVVLAIGIVLFALAKAPFGTYKLSAAPRPRAQASKATGQGPSLNLVLAAARMREAHVLAAQAHPEAVHSVVFPEVTPPGNAPNPIPAGFFFPGPGMEAATITDFAGFTGISAVSGTGTDTLFGVSDFDTDVRFMKGHYIGVDGQGHDGTFVFL